MSKHTPGPWIADDNEGFSGWSIWSGSAPSGYGNGIKIATVNGDSEESDATARLIAAAPEMFDFINEFIDAWESGYGADSYLLRKARRLATQVEGEV